MMTYKDANDTNPDVPVAMNEMIEVIKSLAEEMYLRDIDDKPYPDTDELYESMIDHPELNKATDKVILAVLNHKSTRIRLANARTDHLDQQEHEEDPYRYYGVSKSDFL